MDLTEAQKNTLISYGLTIVAGLPFSSGSIFRVIKLREKVDHQLSNLITWYAPSHMHVTLAAPLRGRYRQLPPLQRSELPIDLEGFIQDLIGYFRRIQPFSLELAGPYLTDEGLLFATAACPFPVQKDLAEILRKFPELDHPVSDYGLHLTIGYLKAIEYQKTSSDVEIFKGEIDKLYKPLIGEVIVDQVRLVHYSNRTLNQVIGKIPFILGEPNLMSVPDFLGKLGIQ